jgi:hypothetical protein
MDSTRDTENLTRAMDDMQKRSRQLGDSLRALADEGLGRLGRAVQQQVGSASGARGGSGSDAGSIAAQELARVLRAEMAETLRQVLTPQATREGGGINIVVHNNTAAQVGVRESTDAFDRRTLEITIDQMVAQSLAQGRQTTSVLQSLFGLMPSLVGR